ncbi:MAG TPA: hypothetical protein VFB96_14340 [Pirellulaceae bacterium]|nr:hypothetical protein [Pirellulaceae bacterium]
MTSAVLVAMILAGQAETPQAEVDEAAKKAAKAQQDKWNAHYARTSAEYEIARGKEGKEKLDLVVKPVLHWSNPVREGETNGAVFVWTYDGRAEVVGTIFSHLLRGDPTQRVMAHSFQSLAQEPLEGNRPGIAGQWKLAGAGVEPRTIPGAPPPAESRPARLAQMRDLARQFSATTVLEGVEAELRLLTQPLHRNEKETGDVLDGALFTYVTGTDPELMLVIEARPAVEGGKAVWHFAAGRFTDLTLKLRHKDAELWTHERGAPREGKPDPYVSNRYEIMPRELP